MKFNRTYAFLIAAVLVVAVALIAITGGFTALNAWLNPNDGKPVPPGYYDNFAKCLTSKGVVMYGLKTCPHCLDQKKMFGSSFQYVNYVECSEQAALCQDKGIIYVPSWEINGNITDGVRPLSDLSTATGCSLQ